MPALVPGTHSQHPCYLEAEKGAGEAVSIHERRLFRTIILVRHIKICLARHETILGRHKL